jgi:hypothetical protein
MTRRLTIPDEVYRKLAHGAARRGMTIESLLTAISELVYTPDQPSEQSQHRADRIEGLFDLFRGGQLNAGECDELNQLIGADYRSASVRADALISASRTWEAYESPRTLKRDR